MIARLLPFALLLVAAAPPPRVEVPIKSATQANGAKRYSVAIIVDGQPVEAGLDTGSTGLRVLAAALPAKSRHGPSVHKSYGAGVDLSGPAVSVSLAIGGAASERATIGQVDKVTCVRQLPDCPAAGADPAAYRIMSDGVAGQGFVAILGIGLAPDQVANPLVQLGAKRWIVELPRPGDTEPGRLVLNPSDEEVARYKQFAMIGETNPVAGCVTATTPAFKLCRPSMIDTGAPGIRVQGGNDADVLPQGAAAQITVGDDKGMVTMPVVIGRRELASAMRLYPPRPQGPPSLSLGIAPYFYWSILYDAEHRRFGVAPR